jgi:flagellar protein FlaF
MAAASLVATAFGIIIILVTAYMLAGSTLAMTEVVTTAQKDMTELQVKMLGTSIQYVDSSVAPDGTVYIEIENNGREPINKYKYADVYLRDSLTREWHFFSYLDSDIPQNGFWTKKIENDNLYKNQWDPGEIINISVIYSGITPDSLKVVTPNGISVSHNLP